MVCPVSLYTESRKRTLVSGAGYTAVGGTKANNLRTSVAAVWFRLAAVLLVFDHGTNTAGLPPASSGGCQRSLTVVFGSKPQKEPEWEHFGPGHLQFLDEQAKQERLTGQREAL